MKYEDVSWHYPADEYPKDLSREAAGTHAGMFLAWALLNGLGGDIHVKEMPDGIASLRTRSVTPGRFFIGECDGKLTDENLSEEGNRFAADYLEPEKGLYLKDYDAVLCAGLETAYHVPDTWQNYDKLKPRLDRRLDEWRRGVLGRKPSWKFWE